MRSHPDTISTPQAGDIKWASIIRPGVTTHSFDNSQRLVDLAITAQADGQISTAAPPEATLAPPGWYMPQAVSTPEWTPIRPACGRRCLPACIRSPGLRLRPFDGARGCRSRAHGAFRRTQPV